MTDDQPKIELPLEIKITSSIDIEWTEEDLSCSDLWGLLKEIEADREASKKEPCD